MKKITLNFLLFVIYLISETCFSTDDSNSVKTKYGILAVSNANALEFNGKLVKPSIIGNNGLMLLNNINLDVSTVVLVRDDGGEACPAMYYFATIGAHGIQISDRFGSCSDLAKIKIVGASVFVTMPDYTGGVDSRLAVAKHLCRYKYEGGVVKQLPPINGRQPCLGD